MNLADAIRKAAQASGVSASFAELESKSAGPSTAVVYQLPNTVEETAGTPLPKGNEGDQPEHGLIRLELFLPPEDMAKLFRSVLATQHSVMTSREAAGHLRVSVARVEELAQSGEIPGFKVDGKWRFLRTKLEAWEEQGSNKEQID